MVPEDPTHNGHILRPLIERVLASCGKPNAKVDVLTNPKVCGFENACNTLRDEVIVRYAHYNLLLFLPDSDLVNRGTTLAELEAFAQTKSVTLYCCEAIPEVEAWLLAGHIEKLTIGWQVVRSHPRLKEEVFVPFLETYGDKFRPGQGRKSLMTETLSNFEGLLTRCPELKLLRQRVEMFLTSSST